ncbi:hypothetical protein JCM10213_007767 [Rhodosporidiobolus nylandii]
MSSNYGNQGEQAQGKESQIPREMGDSNASMKGDTSSKPNVNNEGPSQAEEGATFKTDKESAQFDAGGSSEATFATK